MDLGDRLAVQAAVAARRVPALFTARAVLLAGAPVGLLVSSDGTSPPTVDSDTLCIFFIYTIYTKNKQFTGI